jgi:hypothetical protein
MVFDAACLTKLEKTTKTKLVAPLDSDGNPDMTKTVLENVHTTYSPECGRIEVRPRGN